MCILHCIGETFQIDWGTQRVTSAQDTIKILSKSYLSSDLTFFTIIGVAQPNMGGQPKIRGGGAQALPKRYKVTPLMASHRQIKETS